MLLMPRGSNDQGNNINSSLLPESLCAVAKACSLDPDLVY